MSDSVRDQIDQDAMGLIQCCQQRIRTLRNEGIAHLLMDVFGFSLFEVGMHTSLYATNLYYYADHWQHNKWL